MGKKTTAENLTAPAVQRYNQAVWSTATLQAEPATIGQKIAKKRHLLDITQGDLAAKLGISQKHLYKLKRAASSHPRPSLIESG